MLPRSPSLARAYARLMFSAPAPSGKLRRLSVLLSLAVACSSNPAPNAADDHNNSNTDDPTQATAPSGDAGSVGGSKRTPDGGAKADAGKPAATTNAPGAHQDGGVTIQDSGATSHDTGGPSSADGGGNTVDQSDSGAPSAPSFADSTLVPHASWTCGMPEGIPSPTGAPVVFTATLTVTNIRDLGKTPIGKRQLVELGAGTFDGPKLKATLQEGGLDEPVVLDNGAVELEEILTLKTKDNAFIYLRVCGTAPNESEPMRVVMDFEAPSGGAYAFLNTAKLVGTRELDSGAKTIKLSVYDVAQVAPSAKKISIENPAGVVDQTWDCKTDMGSAGTQVYQEVVNIGDSRTVGASKNGTRNIIPITGGTTTGRIQGSVLPGGGDFQILDTGFVLDARYTLLTHDKELIIVRNCGPADALVPVFETRTDGPYAFMNANNWLSSSPTVGLGTVTLTITEKR